MFFHEKFLKDKIYAGKTGSNKYNKKGKVEINVIPKTGQHQPRYRYYQSHNANMIHFDMELSQKQQTNDYGNEKAYKSCNTRRLAFLSGSNQDCADKEGNAGYKQKRNIDELRVLELHRKGNESYKN